MTAEPPAAKPRHLAADHARQFEDSDVAIAYRHRPPYPPETFAIVETLLGPRPRCVVELGAGTGDFTLGLAPCVDRLVAIEPSRPMLEAGRRRPNADAPHVEWLPLAAEAYAFDGRYAAVVAAEAFHWLDWSRVVPRIAASLAPGGQLVLVERTLAAAPPWDGPLQALIREYSTNQDYTPYDIVAELVARGLVAVGGSARTAPVVSRQPIDDYVESFHSRNGFSRTRMRPDRARAFDEALTALARDHCPDGVVELAIQARVVWGRPARGEA